MDSPKKAYIKSFGCQMNVYDAERMHDLLQEEGYTPTDTPDDADLIVLNTCNIREKAVEKVYSDIGRLRVLGNEREKDGKPRALVAVAGCVAQAEGQEIMRRAPTVDFVFGPQSYHRLPDLLQSARKGQRPVEIDFPAEDKFNAIPDASARTIVERGPSAFLTIQEGCDKFCTFCVVPYTRGAEYSRPLADIVREAKNLVAAGVREITLLGQNVNAYHGEGAGGKTISLATLLAELASLDGVKRLRYTTSHPRDMDDALINAHGDIEALMPYLHLPVQSGSDRILAAMNRKHDAKLYFDIIDKVRAVRPDIAISSDFIVGFPGETDEDFEQTMELVRRVGFSQSFSFKYSPRPGTPAADEAAQIPESVKNERLYALQALLEEQRQAFHESLIGRTMDVLFEKKGRYEGQLNGRSPYLQPVQVEGITENLIGQIHPVTITAKSTNSLFGIL